MAKYRVACLEVYHPDILAEIQSQVPEGFEMVYAKSYDEKERLDLVADADFILFAGTFPLVARHLEATPKLKLIQKWGIGVDMIDLKAVAARGVPLAITAGSNATVVAEHTIMLMLAALKRLAHVDHNLRQGRWLKSVSRTFSYQMRGKTVGIVGFGNIGKEVTKRLKGFECRVIYFDTIRPTPEVERQLDVTFRSLDDLLREADVVSVHVPLTPQTEKLIDARRLSLMKRTAVLVNCARGGVVDEAALVDALKTGTIHGAGIDVFAEEPAKAGNPLFALENVVLTPHSAGSVIDNVANIARHCFRNMQKVAGGEPLSEADLIRVK